jgi:hypothetical protein
MRERAHEAWLPYPWRLQVLKPLGAVLSVVLLAGCTAQVIPPKLQRSPSELVSETNYAIGAVREAYVGETIVKIRNYRVERVGTGHMIPDQSFDIAVPGLGNADLHVEKGKKYPWRGSVTEEGALYDIVDVPAGGGKMGILLTKDTGEVTGRLVQSPVPMFLPGKHLPTPAGPRFTHEVEARKVGIDQVHYELIYSGMSGRTINLSYREFTTDGMARPAFTQELHYNADEPTLRFRNLQVGIREATNEKLTYVVLADQ